MNKPAEYESNQYSGNDHLNEVSTNRSIVIMSSLSANHGEGDFRS